MYADDTAIYASWNPRQIPTRTYRHDLGTHAQMETKDQPTENTGYHIHTQKSTSHNRNKNQWIQRTMDQNGQLLRNPLRLQTHLGPSHTKEGKS